MVSRLWWVKSSCWVVSSLSISTFISYYCSCYSRQFVTNTSFISHNKTLIYHLSLFFFHIFSFVSYSFIWKRKCFKHTFNPYKKIFETGSDLSLAAIDESKCVLSNSGNCLTFEVSDYWSSYAHWFPQASTSLHPGWEFQCVSSSWGVSGCPNWTDRHWFGFTFLRSFLHTFDLWIQSLVGKQTCPLSLIAEIQKTGLQSCRVLSITILDTEHELWIGSFHFLTETFGLWPL